MSMLTNGRHLAASPERGTAPTGAVDPPAALPTQPPARAASEVSAATKTLADVLRLVPECVAAAWLDARTAEVRELRRADESATVAFGIEAAASVVCAEDRPSRTVLIGESHLFVAQRTSSAKGPVLLVVFRRSSNIGLSIATIRTLVPELERP